MQATKEQLRNRKKWIKALRSGQYTQGRGGLHFYKKRSLGEAILGKKPGKFCCLGVSCDSLKVPVKISDLKSTLSESDHIVAFYSNGEHEDRNYERYFLPEPAKTLLGFSTRDPRVVVCVDKQGKIVICSSENQDYPKIWISLTELNDRHLLPFSEIANILESQILNPNYDGCAPSYLREN